MSNFEQLPGLPATGPWPVQFSATGQGTHREGFVVRISPDHGESWVGNFQPGLTGYRAVHRHPNGRHLIVISGGQGYVIDPERKTLAELVGGAIKSVHPYVAQALLVLDQQGVAFFAIGRAGRVWHTRRLSWDGFRNVEYREREITGEGWNVMDQKWQPFQVDVRTGRSSGGAYMWESPSCADWEQLADDTHAG
jgi:hypothetical protein